MLTFTPDGTRVVVANEGEPNDDYSVDPEGSVSIIDLAGGVEALTEDSVRTAGFSQFNDAELDARIRIYGPNATVAQDLEPEYVAIAADGATAYVTLQENNALAVVDLANAEVTALLPLGFKNYDGAGRHAGHLRACRPAAAGHDGGRTGDSAGRLLRPLLRRHGRGRAPDLRDAHRPRPEPGTAGRRRRRRQRAPLCPARLPARHRATGTRPGWPAAWKSWSRSA